MQKHVQSVEKISNTGTICYVTSVYVANSQRNVVLTVLIEATEKRMLIYTYSECTQNVNRGCRCEQVTLM